ncbi:MAG: hypothetical protein MK105_04350 [Crocinitomicaceae bacterium]|nr:hypothetical protein [Crocinitomicaceae bacterium]
MIKHLLYIALFLFPIVSFAQDKATIWEQEKDYLDYRKGEKYKGPEDWYGSYPADMNEEEEYSNYGGNSNSGSGSQYNQGIQYSPQQIQKDRQKRYRGFDRGGSNGDLPFDPKVERPDPIEIPDIDTPDIDPPDLDLDIDTPRIPPVVWNVLLFILIFAVILWVAYLIMKNKEPSNKKVIVDIENDWNPEVITKTELEKRLDDAMLDEDYRECVRIYFTFILKELIRKSWVTWKKEKTNYHYVLEINKRSNAQGFNECVRIYDLVWYGDYKIDKEIFELLKPSLEDYYKSLNPVNE